MQHVNASLRNPILRRINSLSLVLMLACGGAAAAMGAGLDSSQADSSAGQAGVAKVASAAGTLLERDKRGWRAPAPEAIIAANTPAMALPGEKAVLDSKNGAVRLALLGNLPEMSASPVLESAVVLRANPGVDLDFTLERGRVELSNRREKGPASVRVSFQEHTWELGLDEGAEVALELYQRWPRGAPFTLRPTPDDVPGVALIAWVLKGEASLKVPGEQYSLHAPPGPAYYHWDSLSGADSGPKRRDKLPAWADSSVSPSPESQAILAAVAEQRKQLAEKPAAAVLGAELGSSDAHRRQLAVYGLAATDNTARVVEALADPKNEDVRQAAIEALRHHIGRGPGMDSALYHLLQNHRRYTPAQAEIVLQFLHGFSDRDREQPETYETLIAYLRSSQLPIRQLAKWQLDQWVPAGKKIAYNPVGPEEERAQAQEEWKKLIPHGKLPPKPKAEEPGK